VLAWRLALGTLFVAVLVGLCAWDSQLEAPGLVLFPVAVGLAVLAAEELIGLFAARGLSPASWSVYLGTLLVVVSNAAVVYWPLLGRPYPADCPLGKLGWPLAALGIGLILAFVAEMRRYERPGATSDNLALVVFAHVYVGLLISFLIHLRLLDRGWGGLLPLASLVAVVKCGDIGAYTIGRLFGRTKLAPDLSPGKTIEGSFGGLAFACAASYLVFWAMGPTEPAGLGWLAYGLLVGIAGMLGDLAESLLKRDAGRKDSSAWMPGFGGVLDVLDSVLLAAPVAYLCWASGLV
jgi:phosphatidate cytidylyltransferase